MLCLNNISTLNDDINLNNELKISHNYIVFFFKLKGSCIRKVLLKLSMEHRLEQTIINVFYNIAH